MLWTRALVDYAGLFPPAMLGMQDAVTRYAAHLTGARRDYLGRFVLPLARIGEFQTALDALPPANAPWQLSVLAHSTPAEDRAAIEAFNSRSTRARISAYEARATDPRAVAAISAAFCSGVPLETWIEISPVEPNLSELLSAIRASHCGAKLRTGGVTADAFPTPTSVAHFLARCRDLAVVCKVTAGLHHPLRGDYPLTYDAGRPRCTMFGFLNVFLAAALLHQGGNETEATALLDERDAAALSRTGGAVRWRDHTFSEEQLAAARQMLCRSFGSCSFDEPIDGLQELKWL